MKNFPCAMGQILFEHVHYFTRCWMYYINCKPLQIIFCTIQITIKKYFHHIVLYLSFFFSMCLVCRLESLFLCEKLMACYNFGPNAKKNGETIHLFKNWGQTIHEVAFPSFLDFKRYFSIMDCLKTWWNM